MSNTARMLYDVARSCFARMLASTRKFFFFSFSRSRNEADRPKRENGKMGALVSRKRGTPNGTAKSTNEKCSYFVLRLFRFEGLECFAMCPKTPPRFHFFTPRSFSLFTSFQDNNNEGKKKQSPRRAPCILTIVFSYSFHKSLQEEEPLPALNTE